MSLIQITARHIRIETLVDIYFTIIHGKIIILSYFDKTCFLAFSQLVVIQRSVYIIDALHHLAFRIELILSLRQIAVDQICILYSVCNELAFVLRKIVVAIVLE